VWRGTMGTCCCALSAVAVRRKVNELTIFFMMRSCFFIS
jgi:hypothetical protein